MCIYIYIYIYNYPFHHRIPHESFPTAYIHLITPLDIVATCLTPHVVRRNYVWISRMAPLAYCM